MILAYIKNIYFTFNLNGIFYLAYYNGYPL
jgi:hypothetical protein